MAGGGGILSYPEEKIIVKISWGLGRKPNNQDEMCGILLGLTLAHDMGISDFTILVDFMITIQHLINGSYPKENLLNLLLKRINHALNLLSSFSLFHIL